jgi:hypothetical protein
MELAAGAHIQQLKLCQALLVAKTPGDLVVKLVVFLSQLLHLLDLVFHQPLYLVPVEGEGVHIIETDWSIILSHHNLHRDRFNSNHHHP